ncbi:MAG TPA: 5,10-methylenetetrahydrofolate reductase [Elusimicrobia bacterium]|nr:MAG: 5,10-methylenetetrahydrofolate reductase [Elusimicrobia bacterium RIFOXYD2_FULL_34_30]HAM39224.1 5,10-methylenetetrahydrofolate reductase [Elusimicrobiota bacterium]
MKLSELFEQKKFVVTSEIGPPKGFHLEKILHEAEMLKGRVSAINVTDNQSSVMRFGSLATCHFLKDKNIEPVYQVVCRDRNRIALQSDILSAAAFGIENLLLLTGDHTKLGDHPQAKSVFDLDSVSLIHTVKKLEEGVDIAGNKLDGEPPRFCIGAVVSPCSEPLEPQLIKMEKKVKAGAQFFQTQAVYEVDKFVKFIEKAKQFGVPIMAGIVILKTVGMAKYMNENVAGIHVPDSLIEELKKDKEKTKSGQTGIEIAARLIKELKPHCEGIHLMPLGWDDKVSKILDMAGL